MEHEQLDFIEKLIKSLPKEVDKTSFAYGIHCVVDICFILYGEAMRSQSSKVFYDGMNRLRDISIDIMNEATFGKEYKTLKETIDKEINIPN